MKLEEKLVSLRKEKGLSQLKLAEMMKVSRQAISRWEVGIAMPSTDNLKCLGELYGVPVDALLNNDIELPLQKAGKMESVVTKVPVRRVGFFVVALFLVLVIEIISYISSNWDSKEIVPIEEMEDDAGWENSEADEFSLNW